MQVPTSTLNSEYQLHTKDSSTGNIATGKTRMNYYYTVLLGEADNYVVERTKYAKAKQNQRGYLLPPDYIKMKTIRWKESSTIWTPIVEIKSLDKWNEITSIIRTSSIPDYWFIFNEQGNLHMELDPIPNADAAANNIEIIYQGYQDPITFPTDYTTGTVTINQGEASVVGSGTSFASSMIGRFLQISGGKYFYEVKSVTDTTHLTLVNHFQESSVSGGSYAIQEVPRLPAEFSYAPLWGAVMDYYLPKDAKKAKEYENKYLRDLALLRQRYRSKTKGAVTPGRPVSPGQGNTVPRNYPNSLIG